MFVKINNTVIKVSEIVTLELSNSAYITLSTGNKIEIKLTNEEHIKQYMKLENILLDK
ncbi:MAG: hypothetical protein RSF67_05070 [Clostridia bacterium]